MRLFFWSHKQTIFNVKNKDYYNKISQISLTLPQRFRQHQVSSNKQVDIKSNINSRRELVAEKKLQRKQVNRNKADLKI